MTDCESLRDAVFFQVRVLALGFDGAACACAAWVRNQVHPPLVCQRVG